MLQKALSPELANRFKKATASVPSPVINIRSYLSSMSGDAPDTQLFFDLFSRELLLLFGSEELTVLHPAEIAEITELQKNKYIQRSWNYRM
jgi:lipoate-protein ligase A